MNQPEATARILRAMQIEMQYQLQKHLNDTGQTTADVAEAAGVSEVVVKRMAAGTYAGLLSYLLAVALAIGKAPIIELKPAPAAPATV